MVDACSGLVFIHFQEHLNTHETLEGIRLLEAFCMETGGAVVQEYMSDSGTAFTSRMFQEHLSHHQQIMHFAGTGAHHHNSPAERSI